MNPKPGQDPIAQTCIFCKIDLNSKEKNTRLFFYCCTPAQTYCYMCISEHAHNTQFQTLANCSKCGRQRNSNHLREKALRLKQLNDAAGYDLFIDPEFQNYLNTSGSNSKRPVPVIPSGGAVVPGSTSYGPPQQPMQNSDLQRGSNILRQGYPNSNQMCPPNNSNAPHNPLNNNSYPNSNFGGSFNQYQNPNNNPHGFQAYHNNLRYEDYSNTSAWNNPHQQQQRSFGPSYPAQGQVYPHNERLNPHYVQYQKQQMREQLLNQHGFSVVNNTSASIMAASTSASSLFNNSNMEQELCSYNQQPNTNPLPTIFTDPNNNVVLRKSSLSPARAFPSFGQPNNGYFEAQQRESAHNNERSRSLSQGKISPGFRSLSPSPNSKPPSFGSRGENVIDEAPQQN